MSIEPVVDVRSVSRTYGHGRSLVRAVAEATLAVRTGEIVGIAGGSGSGKSTLLRLIAGMEPPSSGTVLVAGEPATRRSHSGFVMPVFQDPVGSLDPRWPIWRTITEPLTAPGRPRISASQRRLLAAEGLAAVGLQGIDLDTHPGELSGGQCQRVSIIRALIGQPRLLVADEPTSALDPSVGAAILRLLRAAADRGTAMVVVSHDRNALAVLCDRVYEMTGGVLATEPSPLPATP
jgi:peptide/nickel transport system ATP-binding protein